MTELVVVPKPQTPGHLESHHAGFECGLILARPNAVLIERQLMIDPEWTAGISALRKERHGRRGDEFRKWIVQVCHACHQLYFAVQSTRSCPRCASIRGLPSRCLRILETRLKH